MSSIINADTTDGVKITSDTSGELKIQSAGTDIATINSNGITLSSGNLNVSSGQQYSPTLTLTDGATIDWNTNSGQVATVTLGGNRTFNAPTNLVNGGFYALEIVQDGTGSRTATWNSVFKFTGATAPTLTTTASAKDYLVFRSDGTNLYEQGRSLGVG